MIDRTALDAWMEQAEHVIEDAAAWVKQQQDVEEARWNALVERHGAGSTG